MEKRRINCNHIHTHIVKMESSLGSRARGQREHFSRSRRRRHRRRRRRHTCVCVMIEPSYSFAFHLHELRLHRHCNSQPPLVVRYERRLYRFSSPFSIHVFLGFFFHFIFFSLAFNVRMVGEQRVRNLRRNGITATQRTPNECDYEREEEQAR